MVVIKSSIPMSFGDKKCSDFSFSKQNGNSLYECGLHWHDCFEIITVRDKSITALVEGSEIELSEGDVILFSPRFLHGVRSTNAGFDIYVFGYTEQVVYSSDISFLNMRYLAPFRYGGLKFLVVRADEPKSSELRARLDDAMHEYDREGFDREIRVRSEILRLHASICSIAAVTKCANKEISVYLSKAELYIKEHIHEDVSPNEIADALHISYSHLARILKSSLGCSAVELITSVKIGEAVRMMLSDPYMSITQIASSLGYSNASYFSRKFAEIRGEKPSEFRKKFRL